LSIRIVLADDQQLMRTGLQMILRAEPDIVVVGEAGTGKEVVQITRRLVPDVVLMDIRMPEGDGLEATRQILSGPPLPTRIVILTTFEDDEYVFEAIRAGASGFLLKTTAAEHLVDAIRVVAAGDALLAPSVTRKLIEEFVRRSPAQTATLVEGTLTDRELAVLKLVARGLSNAEIADQLFLSEATVKTHVGRVLGKLELRDRAQVIVFAYEAGIVRPGSV
jgi:DNA-binding NarL/FixJ family response regulator